MKKQADPFSEILLFSICLEFWTMDKTHKPSDSEPYTIVTAL
jgi:hypothetical protein